MCKRCLDAVKEIFPDVPDNEVGDFLFGCTCFPFGNPEHVRDQLVEMKSKVTDWRECYALADAELTRAM